MDPRPPRASHCRRRPHRRYLAVLRSGSPGRLGSGHRLRAGHRAARRLRHRHRAAARRRDPGAARAHAGPDSDCDHHQLCRRRDRRLHRPAAVPGFRGHRARRGTRRPGCGHGHRRAEQRGVGPAQPGRAAVRRGRGADRLAGRRVHPPLQRAAQHRHRDRLRPGAGSGRRHGRRPGRGLRLRRHRGCGHRRAGQPVS